MNNELIEAAKAIIACWDSGNWENTPKAELIGRLRAALSVKPEPLPEVKKWISFNCFFDHYITNQTVIKTAIVYTYLQQLTAAHAAELAAIEHERSGVEGAMYARILALEAELAEKEKTK